MSKKKLQDVVKACADLRLDKATMEDKRSILEQNLRMSFEPAGEFDWLYLIDFDEQYVYFEIYDYDNGAYLYYRVGYEFNGTMATFEDEVEEVVRNTSYEVVEPMNDAVEDVDRSMSESKLFGWLDKYFGETKNTTQIIKQFDDEQMVAIEPLYIAAGEVDGHGDTYELATVYGMVDSLNKAIEDGRLQFRAVPQTKDRRFRHPQGLG